MSAWAGENTALTASGSYPTASVDKDHHYDFDIPAQPLAAALYQYGDASRQPALFEASMIAGRTSSAVRGRYPPEIALRRLLEGTGLVAQKLRSEHGETFVLKVENDVSAAAPTTMPGLLAEGSFPGLVQTRIWQALCTDSRTEPGNYSSVFRFQIDATGRISAPRLLGTTGDATRDSLLLEALRRVHIDHTPPAELVQKPLTMVLLPIEHDGQRCAHELRAF